MYTGITYQHVQHAVIIRVLLVRYRALSKNACSYHWIVYTDDDEMITSDSKRKIPPAALKKTLKNDSRNIARIAGIDGTNVLDGIGIMDENMYRRITVGT